MQKISCSNCGSLNLVKQGDEYVCQSCGQHYYIERKETITLKGKVEIDKNTDYKNLIMLARRARELGNKRDACDYYKDSLAIYPNNWEAYFFSAIYDYSFDRNRDYMGIAHTAIKLVECLPNINAKQEALLTIWRHSHITEVASLIQTMADHVSGRDWKVYFCDILWYQVNQACDKCKNLALEERMTVKIDEINPKLNVINTFFNTRVNPLYTNEDIEEYSKMGRLIEKINTVDFSVMTGVIVNLPCLINLICPFLPIFFDFDSGGELGFEVWCSHILLFFWSCFLIQIKSDISRNKFFKRSSYYLKYSFDNNNKNKLFAYFKDR